MRIIAGQHRGIALTEVGKGDAGAHLRPTTDRVRESLFNMLMGGRFGDPITGARVLDLFAGTGALGLEALSRGAQRVCFIENGRAGFQLIAKNVAKLRAAEATTLTKQDATKLGQNPYAPFDLIFLDPPYGKNMGAPTLENALAKDWIAKDALIVWEEESAQPAPPSFEVIETKAYGNTIMTLLQLS
ncbi:MAG: 16S rRNA (guanine(966)-N(2))-methyltransferase RsmD [Pseudomonadota bacterium]